MLDHEVEFNVSTSDEGKRLDMFVAEHLGASRAFVQQLITSGLVRADSQKRAKSHILMAGERVTVKPLPKVEQEQCANEASFRIAYEDEYLIVVDKPAGVVVHPARVVQTGTLVQALKGKVAGGDDPVRPGVVHRLDRDTSGLLVLARTQAVWESLSSLIAKREVVREYQVLVQGRPAAETGTIEAPIGRDRRVRTRMAVDAAAGRHAVTHFEITRKFTDSTLLVVRLETGRTHQIRVHLQAIGNPVVGDPEYGESDMYGLKRQFLHASRIEFLHPVTGERINISSALPVELVRALEVAEAV